MEKCCIFAQTDYVFVRDAIEILLNNGCVEAKRSLSTKRNDSSLLNAASSFVDFLGSILSLDESDISEAIHNLKETQKFCELQKTNIRPKKSEDEHLGCLMNEIFITDAELFIAILTILKQGVKDYVKGAFLIRKSWKQYKKNYEKVLKIGGCFLKCPTNESCQTDLCHECPKINEHNVETCADLPQESLSESNSEALMEVRAAIAFGYGLFHLVVSFIPPKFLSVVELLGFVGNQELGLLCLTYVCHSQDVKAELSRLGLLWFHAIVRPIYALDDNDVLSGLQEASELLQGLSPQLLMSSVGLYFEGLLFRCKGNFSDATKKLKLVFEKPISHKEILTFCDYEIGWCHLLDMKWDLAIDAFRRVKDGTVWSKCFYAYLIGVVLGLQGNIKDALVYVKYVPSFVKRKSPLGLFLIRKANNFIRCCPQETECLLLLLEIIYLWECLPTCSMTTHTCFLNGIQKPVQEEYVALQSFLLGYIFQRLGHITRSVEYYKNVISQDHYGNGDTHLKPLAFYELGVTSVKMAQFEKGKEFFKKAKEVSGGYDFENRLRLKLDVALSRVLKKWRELEVSGNAR